MKIGKLGLRNIEREIGNYMKTDFSKETALKIKNSLSKKKRIWGSNRMKIMPYPNPKPRFCRSDCKHKRCNIRKFKWRWAYNSQFKIKFTQDTVDSFIPSPEEFTMAQWFFPVPVETRTIVWDKPSTKIKKQWRRGYRRMRKSFFLPKTQKTQKKTSKYYGAQL